MSEADNDPHAISFAILTRQPTFYAFDVDASQPGWLFLADANYPGWRATVDGRATPVFSAQLLGKAVAIPVGKHKVELHFSSSTFRYGLLLSLASLAIAAGLLLRHLLGRRRRLRQGEG